MIANYNRCFGWPKSPEVWSFQGISCTPLRTHWKWVTRVLLGHSSRVKYPWTFFPRTVPLGIISRVQYPWAFFPAYSTLRHSFPRTVPLGILSRVQYPREFFRVQYPRAFFLRTVPLGILSRIQYPRALFPAYSTLGHSFPRTVPPGILLAYSITTLQMCYEIPCTDGGLSICFWSHRNMFSRTIKLTGTVKHVCNDHLYNKIYYLWFIQ